MIAEGDIQPTARSVIYRVRIEYKADEAPRIFVLSPKLDIPDGKDRLPHVYPGDRLCLFLPGAEEWTSDMSLAHTIVPWISEWLFFYETWRVLGVWLGGGVEPAARRTIRNEEAIDDQPAAVSHSEPGRGRDQGDVHGSVPGDDRNHDQQAAS